MFIVFLFYKEKELLTGEGCVGVVIPWQLCQAIGPLTLHSQEMEVLREILAEQIDSKQV